MKAYVYRRYGGPEVVELVEVTKPVPKADEILIEVRATTITAGDWRALTLDMPRGFGPFGRFVFGVRTPRQPILGLEFAGVVAEVGASVTRFRRGDAVFGTSSKMGCHAQYVCVPAEGPVAAKPEGLSFEEAAALSFGGETAIHFLEKAGLARGDRVLVLGASGAVGTAVVQLADHMGAHVTGTTSTPNLDLVRSIGAERGIDYTKEDALAMGERYDIIVDTVGEAPFDRCEPALAEGGRLLLVATTLAGMVGGMLRSKRGTRRIIAGVAQTGRERTERLAQLATAGALRPVIDHVYAFEVVQDMREAHARVASRRKRGNVVVRVANDALGPQR